MSYILCITVKQSYNWDGNYEDVDAVDLDGEYADFDEAVGVANAICANHRHDKVQRIDKLIAPLTELADESLTYERPIRLILDGHKKEAT